MPVCCSCCSQCPKCTPCRAPRSHLNSPPLAIAPCTLLSRCLCPATAAAAADAAAPVKGDLLNVSYYPSRADAANVSKGWYIIDAKGQTLGRLATLAATYIRSAGAEQQGAVGRELQCFLCQLSLVQQRLQSRTAVARGACTARAANVRSSWCHHTMGQLGKAVVPQQARHGFDALGSPSL